MVLTSQVVKGWLSDSEWSAALSLGVNFRGTQLLKQPADPAALLYVLDAAAPVVAKSGSDAAEALVALWQETEFVSIESPLADHDAASLQLLRKVSPRRALLCAA